MKKLSYVVLLLTFLLLLVSCESPMKVKLHELDDVIGAFFNRSQLKEGGNCSIGYQNGNIRTSKVALSWSVSSDEDFVFYKLYRDGEDLGVFNDVNFTSYSDSLVQENTSYDYEIAVFVRSGMAAVDTIKIKTPQWQAPSNLMANGLSNTDVVLTWDDNSDSEENFMLYFYDTTESLVDSFIIGANVTEKTITDLDPAGYYGFAVQAISQWEKERPLSETEWFDMTDFIFAAPGNLTCQQNYGDMSVELNWVDNSTLETGYCIERKINSNDFVELTQISEINLCTYTDADTTTYAIGDTLVYRVRAYNSYEELIYTNYSNECTVIIVDMQQSIITIHVQVDSYPSEASWNLYNVDTGEFYFDDYQTFSYANQETTVITYLNPGSYTVHCADTFGDGGIAGEVIHNGIQLITWDDDDYGSNGYFSFTVGTE